MEGYGLDRLKLNRSAGGPGQMASLASSYFTEKALALNPCSGQASPLVSTEVLSAAHCP